MREFTMSQSKAGGMLDLLIVGAGFAGLYMLYKARQMGLSARVIEVAGDVGGTWYHKRYPGARVDIQSMEYSFQAFPGLQQEWHWTERYAAQPELLRYARHIAERFGLFDGIELDTRIAGAAFDENAGYWRIQGAAGKQWSARFLVLATGPLSSPNTPAFKRLERFAGRVHHTARWPHQPVDFAGKRVGIIGTGSSAVQAIPLLAAQASELTVFQRTAAYAVPAHNGPLDPAYEARIKADYDSFRARNRRMPAGIGCELPPNPQSALAASAQELEAGFEARWQVGGFSFLGAFYDILLDANANALAAEFIRNKIRSVVHDPATAALLSPRHTLGCKRLCVDSGYYATYNRANVHLVDVSEHPIDEITPAGLISNGREYVFDTLVLATGFDAMTGTLMRLDLRGRGGLTIFEKWRAGPLNYLGLAIAGFPNLFNIGGPGSTSAFTNLTVSIEHHVDWIGDCIAHMRAGGHATIEASAQAEAAWIEHVNAVAQRTLFLTCNSWYLGANIPGKPRMFMPLVGFPAYADRCAEVSRNGYEGFVLA